MPIDLSLLRERRFGDTLTVSELNGYIKSMFDNSRELNSVTVKGEISNLVYHRSGHLYFSLKDNDSHIKAMMFRSSAASLKFILENGMKVIIHGTVSVYTRDGSYQLYANSVQPDGIGALYLAYEQLKERLDREGLFDTAFKKPLPKYPHRIGVITSPTGAAVRDIINVISRRYPVADIYLYPSLVQGEGAEENLIKAVEYFDKSSLCDVVIIGRGGGSIEDLWAFNSERLARAIFSCSVPVISAVGHETDFTICDFVSDMRAPTPSAAAELSVPDIRDCFLRVDGIFSRMSELLLLAVERKKRAVGDLLSKIDNPLLLISSKRAEVEKYGERADVNIRKSLDSAKHSLLLEAQRLEALNPLSVLKRGFSYTSKNEEGITSVKNIKLGDRITVRLYDGTLSAEVKGKEEVKK